MDKQNHYFLIRGLEASAFLNESEQKQLLMLLEQLETRRRWWGYEPTEFIVLQRVLGDDDEPEWQNLESAAKANATPPLTYVCGFPKEIRSNKFTRLFTHLEFDWGMSIEEAMATYPSFREGDDIRYKAKNGALNEGSEQRVNPAIPLAGDSAETACQLHVETCHEGMESGQETPSTNGYNAAR
ncbi:hypothetical protein ACW5XW_02840 [Aeromonas piscicola]|uniref:hypothetical protein n=1 Tax=Aeromonas piscicola TaxID=600645 RepID=UPI0005B529DD|nr:hypothetical protein [Aeromonas piscicola]